MPAKMLNRAAYCGFKALQAAMLIAAIGACFSPVGPFHGLVGLAN